MIYCYSTALSWVTEATEEHKFLICGILRVLLSLYYTSNKPKSSTNRPVNTWTLCSSEPLHTDRFSWEIAQPVVKQSNPPHTSCGGTALTTNHLSNTSQSFLWQGQHSALQADEQFCRCSAVSEDQQRRWECGDYLILLSPFNCKSDEARQKRRKQMLSGSEPLIQRRWSRLFTP